MRLDLSDLQLFVHVTEAGSITRGAARAHLAVASVSARIKEMERSLGATLLIRDTQGVRPSDNGRALLHHAYPLLRGLQYMQEDLAEYGRHQNGYVRICSNVTALVAHLPPLIDAFLKAWPQANLRVDELLSQEIITLVEEGSADIGVISRPADTRALKVLPFSRDRLVVVVGDGKILPGRKKVGFAELLEHDPVGLGRGTGFQILLEEQAKKLGKPMRQQVQLRNFEATCALVSCGRMIGIVPESVVKRWQSAAPQIRIVQLSEDWANLDIFLCVKTLDGLGLHARRFLDMLRAASHP